MTDHFLATACSEVVKKISTIADPRELEELSNEKAYWNHQKISVDAFERIILWTGAKRVYNIVSVNI